MEKYSSISIRNPFYKDRKVSKNYLFDSIEFNKNSLDDIDVDKDDKSIIKSDSVLIDFIDNESENTYGYGLEDLNNELFKDNSNNEKIVSGNITESK